MAFKVITLQAAEMDVESTIEWYEEQKPLLGLRFYEEFLFCLYKLTESPQHYKYAYKGFRQIALPHFPYKIIYFIAKEEVVIHAVFHDKQNPEELIKRLK